MWVTFVSLWLQLCNYTGQWQTLYFLLALWHKPMCVKNFIAMSSCACSCTSIQVHSGAKYGLAGKSQSFYLWWWNVTSLTQDLLTHVIVVEDFQHVWFGGVRIQDAVLGTEVPIYFIIPLPLIGWNFRRLTSLRAIVAFQRQNSLGNSTFRLILFTP